MWPDLLWFKNLETSQVGTTIGTVEHIGIHIELAIKTFWLIIEWIRENHKE
jgi:hypothetical protein